MGEIRRGISLQDFCSVYKVFREEPFLEAWPEEEIKNEYDALLKKSAWMLGYFEKEKCIGIITLYPCIVGEHPVKFKNFGKVLYLSDVAVLQSYRRKGIGGLLFDEAIKLGKKAKFEVIYMRTNAEVGVSKSIGIAKERGFREMSAIQRVTIKRTDGKIKTDTRLFLKKHL